MTESLAQEYETLLAENAALDRTHLRRQIEGSQYECFRPGVTRLNIPFFMDKASVNFIVKSVLAVAEFGWKLLPMYRLDAETGEWSHWKNTTFVDRKWLSDFSVFHNQAKTSQKLQEISTFEEILENSRKTFETADREAPKLGQQIP